MRVVRHRAIFERPPPTESNALTILAAGRRVVVVDGGYDERARPIRQTSLDVVEQPPCTEPRPRIEYHGRERCDWTGFLLLELASGPVSATRSLSHSEAQALGRCAGHQ